LETKPWKEAMQNTMALQIVFCIAGIHYTCWSQPYNEEKDRKVIEYVEDWLSHIEWTNQDIVG